MVGKDGTKLSNCELSQATDRRLISRLQPRNAESAAPTTRHVLMQHRLMVPNSVGSPPLATWLAAWQILEPRGLRLATLVSAVADANAAQLP